MSRQPHVHVPYSHLGTVLPFLIERNLPPEVAFLGPDLDTFSPDFLKKAGERLKGAGLEVTVHGPFHDLNPGAMEPLVLEATRQRFRQTLQAAGLLGAALVVFHPGFDHWKYGGQNHLWLGQNLKFWPYMIELAAKTGCVMALENIFEETPATLAGLLTELDSPWLGHCFDVGHWHLFAKVSLPEWFTQMGSRIIHLHLHDNWGKADDHLPVGEGKIDFPLLFRLVKGLDSEPSMTLEAHDREAVLRSLAGISPFLSG